jgi:hypothetical protein
LGKFHSWSWRKSDIAVICVSQHNLDRIDYRNDQRNDYAITTSVRFAQVDSLWAQRPTNISAIRCLSFDQPVSSPIRTARFSDLTSKRGCAVAPV